ncbi:hypothetical protein Tco_0534291 [Tanacetum coccineum]
MGSFIKWYCKQSGKLKLSKANLEGSAYKLVKAFHSNIISFQFQMEEYKAQPKYLEGFSRAKDDLGLMGVDSGLSLSWIVLHKADYKEYKISEADFKNLHPNDFEDLYLLHLQGKLNHLSGTEKVHLFNAVNLWISNIVIKKRMEDLQLGIQSYQTKLNLTQLNWDASDFLFKEDYTIVSKPRAVIYRDRND